MEFVNRLEAKIKRQKEIIDHAQISLKTKQDRLEGLTEAFVMYKYAERKKTSVTTKVLRQGSRTIVAQEYLRKLGKPDSVENILKNSELELTPSNKNALRRSMRDHIVNDNFFTENKEGMFGLKEFESPDENSNKKDIEGNAE